MIKLLETIDALVEELGSVDTIKVPEEIVSFIPPVPGLNIVSHNSPFFIFIDAKGEILSVQNIPR